MTTYETRHSKKRGILILAILVTVSILFTVIEHGEFGVLEVLVSIITLAIFISLAALFFVTAERFQTNYCKSITVNKNNIVVRYKDKKRKHDLNQIREIKYRYRAITGSTIICDVSIKLKDSSKIKIGLDYGGIINLFDELVKALRKKGKKFIWKKKKWHTKWVVVRD